MSTETLKKALYAGIGIGAIAIEKIKETTKELVEQEKISEDDGKKIVTNFIQHIEAKKQSFEQEMHKLENIVVNKLIPNNADIHIEEKDTLLF